MQPFKDEGQPHQLVQALVLVMPFGWRLDRRLCRRYHLIAVGGLLVSRAAQGRSRRLCSQCTRAVVMAGTELLGLLLLPGISPLQHIDPQLSAAICAASTRACACACACACAFILRSFSRSCTYR
jgi:hypothetical protein